MQKILTVDQAASLSEKLRKQGKKIVLTGGCFDILHIGHVRLFEKAKKQGDVLFVFLESDATIKVLKGENRPIHPQNVRAELLASLSPIDYIVTLPKLHSDNDYDELVFAMKPAIIATTKGDPAITHKLRQAEMIQANVVEVIEPIKDASTSRLAELLRKQL